jgi:hypothetical protein
VFKPRKHEDVKPLHAYEQAHIALYPVQFVETRNCRTGFQARCNSVFEELSSGLETACESVGGLLFPFEFDCVFEPAFKESTSFLIIEIKLSNPSDSHLSRFVEASELCP